MVWEYNMKKKWYKGKSFVITGASGDIGSEVCRKFAPLGMRMYLTDLKNPKLDKLVEEVKELGAEHAEALEMDVTNREQVNSVIKQIGEKEKYIDILYNNAGFGNKTSVTNEGTFDDYRKIMSVNVDGMWLVLKAALPYIGRPSPTKKNPDRKEGQLIFMSSSAGKVGIPNMAAYCMSKHAVVALADSIRLEYKMMNHKIHIITICPAPAKTSFWDSTPEYQEWLNDYEKKGILYKLVSAEQVANAVLKASRKNRREVFVPRWWRMLDFGSLVARGFVGNLMIKIEKGKEDMPKG
ncbi:MAG: SDR family NAD(P)-dependent oxidoreductase [Candidatus Lokiarchaeota archaeon]|nr:SDR family NAD(P)-dependent oxidoreductase [Candidatus Lokiarchaeota archaeon]